jgi:RNA polymerase sigma factor (sigma-70 family)
MRDSEVVASIVAGDPHGLAMAYDRYADSLFKYCRTLLSDPADAADAVQDTFVIAATRLDGLRAPERLRAWLYAVARNECLRILRAKKGTSALDEAPDVTDHTVDVSEHAERAELRTLFEHAAAGLNPGEREVIELQLRQGLEAGEVATVLGVSRNHAHTLLSRARGQLETCLAVLLVGRAGRDECDELGSLLTGWDGRLTVLLRKRVHRHIEHCVTCTARRAAELRPAMLLDLSPGAALTAGALESLHVAFGVPSGLRGHTLALASGHGPVAAAHSAAVLARAGAFGKAGFPKPVHTGQAVLARPHGAGRTKVLRSPKGQAAVAVAVVIAVAVAAVAFALTGNEEHFTPSAGPKPPASGPPPASPAAGPAPRKTASKPAPKPSPSAAPTVVPASPAPAQATAGPPPALMTAGPLSVPATRSPSTTPTTASATPPPRASPVPATPSATPPRPSPVPATPSAAPPPSRPSPVPTTPSPAPTPTTPSPAPPPPSPAPAPTTASPTPPPAPRPAPTGIPPTGILSVVPEGGTLIVIPGSAGPLVALHASGGAVTWSVSVTNDPNHLVTVSPAAGTLTTANPTASVTIGISQFVECGIGTTTACPTVTISPGNVSLAVWTGWTLPLLTSPLRSVTAAPGSPRQTVRHLPLRIIT